MSENEQINLQYPIGKFIFPELVNRSDIEGWISDIKNLPKKLIELTSNFNEHQLNTTYRPNGWTTAKQVIHHIYDSHHNSYTRFKWALTEVRPVIKAYHEDLWAALLDYQTMPIEISLDCIAALHKK